MQAEMLDTSREFSLDRKSFGAKKQWLNPCIQVVTWGLGMQLDGTHQKPETRQAETVSPGDRLER